MVGRTIAHYRVIAEIGSGGMGVVYRARDLKLDRLVAIKFLAGARVAEADDDLAERAARFIAEAKTASAINHPNICTIYAIDRAPDGRLYMVMAWYEGETLEAKIRRGPLPFAEVVRYGAQAAAGLAAAHARGVIHRDIKPANLMVTANGVVKVLDFGLAGLAERGRAADRPLGGSAAYLAPELVGGELTGDERTDVWAMGVVLHEMVTGERLFRGATDVSVLYAVASHEPAISARALESAPPALRRIIEKALAPRDRRYRSAAELFIDLDALRVRSEDGRRRALGPGPRERRAAGRRWPSMALAALVLVALVASWVRAYRGSPDRAGHGPTVAVSLGFMDRSAAGDRWLCDAFEELLVFAVPESMRLRWRRADSATVEAFQKPGGYAAAGGLERSVLARLRAAEPAASRVLSGSCRASDEGIDVEVRVQDLDTGATVGLWPASGAHGDLIALGAALSSDLAGVLGVEPRRDGPPLPPLDRAAADLLAWAREALRRHDSPAAYERLQRAITRLPKPPPQLQIAAADALLDLGRIREAQWAAAEAMRAARGAPLRLQAAYRVRALEALGQRARAAALARALWRSERSLLDDPEALDRAFHLGALLAQIGDRAGVDEVLDGLRAAGVDDPRRSLVEAHAARRQARNREQIEALRLVLDDRGLRRRQPLLWARARLMEAQPLRRLGRRTEALAAAREARAIFEAAGLDVGVADSWTEQGNVEWDRQDLRAARGSFEKATLLYRVLGDDRKIAHALHSKALLLEDFGEAEVEAASRLYEQVHQLLRPLHDPVAEVYALTNHANLLVRTGRFAAADAAFARAREIDAALDGVDRHAFLRASLGGFLRWRGQLAAADRLLDEALDLARPAGDRLQIATAAVHRGYLLLDRGDPAAALAAFGLAREELEASADHGRFLAQALRGEGQAQLIAGQLAAARASLERARALLEAREQPRPGELESALAALRLAEGHAGDSARLARAAIETLAGQGKVLALAEAHDGLAAALLASGRPVEAASAVERGRALIADIEVPVIQVPLAITAARCALARGETETARRDLRWAHGTAARLGLGRYRLEASLVEAEGGLLAGDGALVRRRLEQLAREVEEKGLAPIVSRARAVAS